MCAAWAQDILDERAYREFLTRILPLLRQTCPAEAGPYKGRTAESQR